MRYTLILTGGGTAGHVTPNLAVIERLQGQNVRIEYIGSKFGVEKSLIERISMPYHAISTGKLRRYLSFKNITDPLRIIYGIWQSFWLLRKLKADIVFSKGGFVAFPVVFSAWLNRIPVIAHESDRTPGLANRLSLPFVTTLCMTFPPDASWRGALEKIKVTGSPIRRALFEGERAQGLSHCGFSGKKPCLMVIGGGQGADIINRHVREALDILTNSYDVIHLCGRKKIEKKLWGKPGYVQFEYVNEDLPDLYAASDIVISRAGSNSLYEILALQKPHVLIPLSRKASRGDQLDNAAYFEKLGVSIVLQEDCLSRETLISAIQQVEENKLSILNRIQTLNIQSATTIITEIIDNTVQDKS